MKFVPSNASGFVPASHENPANPGVLKRVIATQQDFQAGQVQMLNWARLPVGSAFQPHYHEDMQEVFVLVSGVVTMTVRNRNRDESAAECLTMRPGDTVMINPTEVHQMQNIGDTVAEYIVFGISSQKGGKTIVVS
jgi:mannose-6-phosphate isomerase-like protein (cupin superfamily)